MSARDFRVLVLVVAGTTFPWCAPACGQQAGSDKGTESGEETAKLQELLNTVRITPLEDQRLETIKKESVVELIEHLPADATFSSPMIAGGGDMISFSDAAFMNKLVPRMARVRRLLAVAQTQRETVCRELRNALVKINDTWAAASEETRKRRTAGDVTGGLDLPNFPAVITATAAVYMLAEIGDYGALDILLKNYALWKQKTVDGSVHDAVEQHGPVPPFILLYGVFMLIQAYPDGAMDEAARAQKIAFLDAAFKVLPPPAIQIMPRWDSVYRWFDPHILNFFPNAQQQNEDLQPTEEISVWPSASWSMSGRSVFSNSFSPDSKQLLEMARQLGDAIRGNQ